LRRPDPILPIAGGLEVDISNKIYLYWTYGFTFLIPSKINNSRIPVAKQALWSKTELVFDIVVKIC
jgi:hypothetical protein